MILHTSVEEQPVSLNIQIKYTSCKASRNVDHVYRVQAMRVLNRQITPFDRQDFDMFFVCLKTSDSSNISFIYCIPISAMADANIVSCPESNIKGKKGFYLAPLVSANDHTNNKPCKYYYLNEYHIPANDPNSSHFQERLKKLIELAAREKLQRLQGSA